MLVAAMISSHRSARNRRNARHKLVAYGSTAILTSRSVTAGLGLGLIIIFNSLIGKKILDRLPEKILISLIEGTLLIAGLRFLIYG